MTHQEPYYYAQEEHMNWSAGDPSYAVHVLLAVEGQCHAKNPTVFSVKRAKTPEEAWAGIHEWEDRTGVEVVMPEDMAAHAKLPPRIGNE